MSSTSSKKIIFKCDQHAAIISEKLQSFYKEKEFFDTILIAGTRRVNIQAHRVVLCASSEYFLETFRGNRSALKGNKVDLKEIEASPLKLIIDFMYSGSIELNLETVGGILKTASFLEIKSLADGCCEFIEKNIDSSNCLSWFRLAHELNLPTMKAISLECTYTHFEKVSKEKELLMLNENELKDLLFNDNPHGDFLEDVFLAMVAWINYDKSNRELLVLQLLSMVRFQALTPEFILENRKTVCRTVESYELICSWLQWHLMPETRTNDQKICALKPRKKTTTKNNNKLTFVKALQGGEIYIETYDPNENAWSIEIEDNLPIRKQNCSPILFDGNLIAVGGFVNSVWTNSAECLDLMTLEWIVLPPMRAVRGVMRLADLNGLLCAVSKRLNSDSVQMEIYDSCTDEWYDVPLNIQPGSEVRIASDSMNVYFLDFNIGLLQSYNAIKNKWSVKSLEMNLLEEYGFAAVKGYLYIIGGIYEGVTVKAVKRFNLSNEDWCDMTSLPKARSGVKTRVFRDEKIIISDGRTVDEYDIDTDTWNTLSPLNKSDGVFDFNFSYMSW